MIYHIRSITEKDGETGNPLWWNNKEGWVDHGDAWGFSPEEFKTLNLPIGGEWIPQPCNNVTIDDLRHRLLDRPMWAHALTVIDLIEEYEADPMYLQAVQYWLTDPAYSTVWLRDVLMEPLRHEPRLVEIGKQFNPTTEWHNTWMPLDTAMHCVRNGLIIGE